MSNFISGRSPHDNWRTPADFLAKLDQEFNFNDDPCPLFGIDEGDGLLREWGTRTFVNPPYSQPRPWIEKAIMESRRGKLVVMLLRGDTSTAWFHDLVWGKCELRFIRGRLKFGEATQPAAFPSIVAIYDMDYVPKKGEGV